MGFCFDFGQYRLAIVIDQGDDALNLFIMILTDTYISLLSRLSVCVHCVYVY